MLIVAVVMEKGGVGKTTIALNLAVAAVQDGHTTAIIDIDPQATVSNWTDRRSHEKPWVVPTPAARITAAIEKRRHKASISS
jgi:chromosome partitioning protein